MVEGWRSLSPGTAVETLCVEGTFRRRVMQSVEVMQGGEETAKARHSHRQVSGPVFYLAAPHQVARDVVDQHQVVERVPSSRCPVEGFPRG